MVRRTLFLAVIVALTVTTLAAAAGGLSTHRLNARAGAWSFGRVVSSGAIFTQRVFSDASHGFALANGNQAEYPVRTVDGGHTWRVCGPQLHVDAADAPEAVSSVAVAGAHTFAAYGPGVVDVTSDTGHTWWQVFPSAEVQAVAPDSTGHLQLFLAGGHRYVWQSRVKRWQ